VKIPPAIRRIVDRYRHRFLRAARGVIHVGANIGQERELYAHYGLDVLWIEPLPEVFSTLERNIRAFPRQRAVQALVTDRDDSDFAAHAEIWPGVVFTRSLPLRGVTLPTLLAREGIDPAPYDALVLDTQGAELLVLRGAAALLPDWKCIKAEAADFEAYAGAARLGDLEDFLAPHGFVEYRRDRFARRPAGGSYYEVVWIRSARGRAAPECI
jgi:FkbM family methyltransferase